MTDKEKKSKIADILLEFYDEYQSNEINRPMIPNIYAGKILDSLQEEPTIPDIVDEHYWEMLGEEHVSNKMGGINNALSQDILAMKSVDEAMAEVEAKAKAFTEAHKGESSEQLLAEMRGENPVSESLEEVAHQYYKPNETFMDGFKKGAKWQKLQMMKEAKLYGWVARDENGSLHLFEVEPSRIEDRGQWWDRDYNCTTLDKNDFPDLEWEDEPVYVKLIILKED